VKSKTKNKVSIGPLVQEEEVVADSEKMANILNSWYCSVFTEEDLSNMPSPEVLYMGDNPLTEVDFTAGKVKKKLSNLKPTSAPGPDRVWARVLHDLSDALAEPLAMVFTSCLVEGVVPADWKRANVTPIFKSGSKGVPGNYRPVSLTCIVCKVMESVLRDSIVDFLAQNELLRLSQHGFMRRRSTLTNLLEYLEKLTSMVDNGMAVDVVYLDFSKAFDKVPIQRLLKKIHGLGIRGRVLAWVEEWLTGRQQRVVINGKASSWENIKSGVVQGSVLGPCLFLMFINDIDGGVEDLGGFVSKFADDSKWAREVMGEVDREQFQQGLDKLMEWSNTWQMAFNKDKCHVLHLGRQNQRYEYSMGGVKLGAAEWEKDLGVIVSQSLRPSLQCAKAAKTANGVLGQLCRGVGYRDKEVFMGLYKTYVRPHLEYAIQAWCPWTAGDKEVLEAVQRRAVKAVSNLRGKSYMERLRELEMDTLEERRKRGDLVQAYRVISGKDNVSPATWFQFCQPRDGEVSTRQTTGHLNVIPKQGKGEIRRNFWSVRVTEPWNSLPNMVKSVETVNCFKNALDNLQGRGRNTRVGQQ
jgi:ribonuclease P/MRP protein subunit RPP40